MKIVTNVTSSIFVALCAITLAGSISACNPKLKEPDAPVVTEATVSGHITSNTTWTADKKYILSGFVYVDSLVTLTIEPGTIIKGDKATQGSLIVKRGAKIIAEGTAAKPIVFTSNQAKGSRAYGDWGGLIILGNAPVNKVNAVVEGENLSKFGGSNPADNSGKLKYVRIEYAGIAFEPDKEINGLTLGGVGSGTEIDYVQVSYANDDSYEWFGGNVNAKHLVAFGGLDDDFDTDNGYAGNVQYAVSLRNPQIADPFSGSVSNGFESDNDGTGSAATPQTNAKFANVSIFMGAGTVNDKYNSAIQIRRNSKLSIYNSVFTGLYDNGLEIKDASTATNFRNGDLEVAGLTFADAITQYKITGATAADSTRLLDAVRNNQFGQTVSSLGLNTAYNSLSAPIFSPTAASALLTNGVTLPAGFESTTYRGAFGTTNWATSWTNFDPQNTDY